jgi:FAD/FMN-containing dehydrogenase
MSVPTDTTRLSRLREELTGAAFSPDDPAATEEATGDCLTFPYSATVVAAQNADDVVAAVRYAADAGLPVAVQATGHGLAEPIEDAVLVSTRAMTDLEVDPERKVARLQPGVRWAQVQAAAAPHGLAGVCGSYSQVGVVGFSVGGGHSPVFGRRYGFGADQVRAFDLVTADGGLRRVDPDTDPDLFWAVRGGKSNFGIVTSLEIDLVAEPSVYGGGIFFPMSAAPALLPAFAEWSTNLPEETSTSISLLRLPPLPDLPEPLRGQAVVHLRFSHLGDPDDAERHLAPMRAVADPILDNVRLLPVTGLDEIHMDPTDPLPFWYSGTSLRELPSGAVDALLEVAGPDTTTPVLMVEVRRLGGAQDREPRHANAVPARGAAYNFFALGLLMPEIADVVPGATDAVIGALGPWDTGEAVPNFAGCRLSPEQVLSTYPAAHRERLRSVKRAVDPDNVFRFGNPIGCG